MGRWRVWFLSFLRRWSIDRLSLGCKQSSPMTRTLRSWRFWAVIALLLVIGNAAWRYLVFPDCPAEWYRLGRNLHHRDEIRAMLTRSGAVLYARHGGEH